MEILNVQIRWPSLSLTEHPMINQLLKLTIVRQKRKWLRLFSTNSNVTIGFIGLGNMGSNMVKNVCQKKNCIENKNVIIYDINSKVVNSICEEYGAIDGENVMELSKRSDIVITMLPNTKNVVDILTSETMGVLHNLKPGSLVIDSSTIDPLSSKMLHQLASEKSIKMLDAPVSGGVTGAAAGTLTFMVGGEDQVVNDANKILLMMGKNIVHCGGAGAGGIAKLCNNMALAISMIGTSEAMSLGVKLGMDPAKLASVMNTSTARCWSSDSYNPVPGIHPNVPASRGYSGGFASVLMEKDLGLAMDAAKSTKTRTPLGSNAYQLYGLLCDHGYANKDFSSVYEYLMSLNNK